MPSLKVRLFGQLSVFCRDESVGDLIPGKAKELLCYLLTHRQRPITRESLATILWEDCTAEHSRQYLRKALWQLQCALSPRVRPAEDVLHVDARWVSVNPGSDIWLDIEEFERVCAAVQGPSCETDKCYLEAVPGGLDLYRGDLLEGWYQDWCLIERERLQNMYLVTLDKVVIYCQASGEYRKGLHYCERILCCDRAHEVAHQHMMRLLYLAGDRAGALRQYERCVAALKEDLRVQPSGGTLRLYQQISEDRLLSHAAGSSSSASGEELTLLNSAFGRLQEVKTALDVLRGAVEDALSHIARNLHPSVGAPGPPKDRPR